MEFLSHLDPKVFESITKLLTTVFTVLSALAAAIWAIVKFFDEKRTERETNNAAEHQRQEQQRIDEQGRRAERVATLMTEFGKVSDPEVRAWLMLALSMYPNETARLLTMSLSRFDDATAAAVSLALVGMGVPALSELVRLNRIANVSIDNEELEEDHASASEPEQLRLLRRTQAVIVKLFYHLDKESVSGVDFSELDLSGCNFKALRFTGISLRKCKLDGAIFKMATIRGANLRGASLEQTNFLKADLYEADFTGATGTVLAIKGYADKACLEHAQLKGSKLDGASLKEATLKGTNLDEATLCGAQMHGAIIDGAHMSRVNATKLKAKHVHCSSTKWISSVLVEADVSESTYERCEMMGMSAKKLIAKKTKYLNCNLGGVDFSQSNLEGAEFRGCILGGADFRGVNLSDTRFHKCQMDTARFDEGVKITQEQIL